MLLVELQSAFKIFHCLHRVKITIFFSIRLERIINFCTSIAPTLEYGTTCTSARAHETIPIPDKETQKEGKQKKCEHTKQRKCAEGSTNSSFLPTSRSIPPEAEGELPN